MSGDPSPKQQALLKLWQSDRADDLIQILAEEPAAREGGLVDELVSQAEAASMANSEVATRLRLIAKALSGIRDVVQRMSTVSDMPSLVSCYESNDLCWSPLFTRMLGGFWSDALHRCDSEMVQGLRKGLRVLSQTFKALALIREFEPMTADQLVANLKDNLLLCDKNFHRFLDLRARLAAKAGDPSARMFRELAGYLRDACQRVSVIAALGNSSGGETLVRIPLSAEAAELWFLVNPEYSRELRSVAHEVSEGGCSLGAGIRTALEIGQRVLGPKSRFHSVFGTAAFLEHVLLTWKPGLVAGVLREYGDVVQGDSWKNLAPEVRATWALRYAKAVVIHWRAVSDPAPVLRSAIDILQAALAITDETVSPRLKRDLYLTKARIQENLGRWDPHEYEVAVEDYHSGLNVPGLAHEAEARGRALSDLANTLQRVARMDGPVKDARILALYEEALTNLEGDEQVVSRCIALNSYAIYLNERLQGDRAGDQEKALALIEQAITILERAIEEEKIVQNPYVLGALAGAYLTKGNVVRGRRYGDDDQRLRAARESYLIGLGRLGDTKHDQLRGVIRLNVGFVCLDLYERTGEVGFARDAYYSYEEACQLLRPYPLDYSQALLGKAMLVLDVPETANAESLARSVEEARQAMLLVYETQDGRAIGKAHMTLGMLARARGKEGSEDATEEAVVAFVDAMEAFSGEGSTENAHRGGEESC